VRNGAACAIESAEVVVGDLLDITTGDQIPGDGVFIMGAELQIDEVLTLIATAC
jgi:magnesium-transporting ATPase (P-type)